MSSNFLNKSGLSYFYSKIKEMLQNKQDKLYAGDNITIADDGRISASVGDSKNVFFGTCDTNSVNYNKVVTCDDWTWEEGNVLCVHFTNANRATGARLVIGAHEAVTVYLYGNVNRAPYTWTSGEVVQFVYTGGKFYTVSRLRATKTIYGMVRLCDDVDLDSSDYAATSFAVKTAYDLANKKQDKLTAGTGITIQNNVISAEEKQIGLYRLKISSADGYYPVFQSRFVRDILLRKTDLSTGTVTNIATGSVQFSFSNKAEDNMDIVLPRGVWCSMPLVGSVTIANTSPAEVLVTSQERLIDCKCKFVLANDIVGVTSDTLFVDLIPQTITAKDQNNSQILYEAFFLNEYQEISVENSDHVKLEIAEI